MSAATTRCYWVESRGRGALREQPLPAPKAGEVLVETRFTGISPGTERLVGLGQVPESCQQAMACPGMQGSFALPAAYGYSLVGVLRGGPRDGEGVFVMHPHQDRAVIAAHRLVTMPPNVPLPRATLLPNLETALNACWDAELRGDETIAVVGAGAIGLLIAFVLDRLHRGKVTIVEAEPGRREHAAALPWVANALLPTDVPAASFAVAFHATGSGAGLQLALDLVGFEGRVIDLSWYGDKTIPLRLGGSFHHQRKRILASQVATVARSHRAAGRAARTRAVLELLADSRLDNLLGTPIPFADLPDFFADLYRGTCKAPCPLVGYPTQP